MANLSLDPENAAGSIASRIETIRKCELYIKETMARYDGLKSLQTLLDQAGITDKVAAICAKD
jgi:hypothetical protein